MLTTVTPNPYSPDKSVLTTVMFDGRHEHSPPAPAPAPAQPDDYLASEFLTETHPACACTHSRSFGARQAVDDWVSAVSSPGDWWAVLNRNHGVGDWRSAPYTISSDVGSSLNRMDTKVLSVQCDPSDISIVRTFDGHGAVRIARIDDEVVALFDPLREHMRVGDHAPQLRFAPSEAHQYGPAVTKAAVAALVATGGGLDYQLPTRLFANLARRHARDPQALAHLDLDTIAMLSRTWTGTWDDLLLTASVVAVTAA